MKTMQKIIISPRHLLKAIIIFFFLLPWMAALSQDYTKKYEEKYDVDKGANLSIKNKFGDIKCQAWDESTVAITVTVKVDASSQDRANRVFDKITVALSGDRTKVQGTTTVGNMNNADFSIDYEIRMPKWINIDLDNQFGDIVLDESDGMVKINLEYGAMEANALNGPKSELVIKFSNVDAGFMKNGNVHLEYSELKSKGAENLQLYSRFGQVTIDKIAILNLDSQYDEIRIGSVGQLISVSRFSELDFTKINGDFDFDIEYGELAVKYISPAFKLGKVRNTFAGANLVFDPKSGAVVDAEMEFGELSYPRSNVSINKQTEGYTTNIYKGKIGTMASPTSQLTIKSKNADVSLDFAE